MRSKQRLCTLDTRVSQHTAALGITYDSNDVPLSKLKYRLAEVTEDYSILLNRQRNHRSSMGTIPLVGLTPIQRHGRSSLVPFRLSMNSS